VLKLRKTYKAVVVLSEESSARIIFLSKIMIYLWNKALVEIEGWLNAADAEGKKPITAYSLNYWLTKERRNEITLDDGTVVNLGLISVDLEREVLRKLAGSFQSYFELRKKKDNRARKPAPKKTGWFQTLSWSSFTIEGDILRVPGYDKMRLEIPLGAYLAAQISGKQIVHATISRNHDGVLELSLVTASPMPDVIAQPKFFRAIDLGAGDIAVSDSDGSEFLIPARRPDKFWHGEVVPAIEKRLASKKKGSRRYLRLMAGRRWALEKNRFQHENHQRKLAHALLEEKVDCVIIGKSRTRLGLAKSGGAPGQHYGAQNTGYLFRLFLFIKEKAAERGVRVIEFPDPRRKGDIEEPENKFHASRELLLYGLQGNCIAAPVSFVRKTFRFVQ